MRVSHAPASAGHSGVDLAFEAISEPLPGAKWAALFARHWSAYEKWFLNPAHRPSPYYLSCLRALRTHMPELVPTYQALVELAGGGDAAARFLSMYSPPPYLTACSQAALGGPHPLLVRNYDYAPRLCEGALLHTAWHGRRVLAMSDSLWGVLDGVNDAGLAVSLSFGGRRVVGDGFGVPIVLRYVLEFCADTREACAVLTRIPVHMAYNVTVVDASGAIATVQVAPDRAPQVLPDAVATNHQGEIEWHEHAKATSTLEREAFLHQRLHAPDFDREALIASFLRQPLYSHALDEGYGTLYTAVYDPIARGARFLWPGVSWTQSIEHFEEGTLQVRYARVLRA